MPGEWRQEPFSSAVLINPPVRLKRGCEYPFVSMDAIGPGSRWVYASRQRAYEGGGSRFQDGDTLLARITPCLENGKIARFKASGYISVAHGSTELIVIRGRAGVTDTGFAYYLTQSPLVRGYAISQMTGTSGRQRVPIEAFEHLLVPIPPLPEQRAIAHILGTLDDKIELNRRMNETLEAIAQALFKSWFIDFDPVHAKAEGRDTGLPPEVAALFPESFEDSELGQIPRGWEVGVLNDLVEAILGGDWGQDEATAEAVMPVRCIRGADIPDLQKGGTGKMPVRFVKPASLRRRQLSDGDIVVEISGGSPTQSTGRPVFVSGRLLGRLGMPVVCSNFCRSIKFRSPMFSRFAYFWLRSLYESDEFLQFENGTTGIKNLAFTRFSSDYKLCIPPLQVLRAFDQQVSCVFDKQQTNAAESDTLSAVRDGLLPRLLSGAVKTDSYVADA